jgi:hypothetical protein
MYLNGPKEICRDNSLFPSRHSNIRALVIIRGGSSDVAADMFTAQHPQNDASCS